MHRDKAGRVEMVSTIPPPEKKAAAGDYTLIVKGQVPLST